MQIVVPQTVEELEGYYELRWRLLRQPWKQPRGSEKDQHEDEAVHAMIIDSSDNIIGVARLHQIDNTTGQIRYMAVTKEFQNQRVGTALLNYLEEYAMKTGLHKIRLNAREPSVAFYQKQGYCVVGDGHTLYGNIHHQIMAKPI